jgi:TonB family protein
MNMKLNMPPASQPPGASSGAIAASGNGAAPGARTTVPARRFSERRKDIPLLPVITLVVWVACVTVGLVGLIWPSTPAPPAGAATQPTADQPQELQVDVTNEPMPDEDQPPPALADQSPAPDVPDAGPPAILAALPSPDIAFEKLVEGPVRLVSAVAAAPSAAETDSRLPLSARSNPRRITYGRGEGVQPAPQYPIEAILDQEQGTVVVRFTVDSQGRVNDAEAYIPCPWPLLNQEAVRAIRETWRFSAGSPRFYEVSIHFGFGAAR